MEHIEDTRAAYRAMHAWLRPGGFMSHSVDYDSHGHARGWNGHWTVPSLAWRIVRGNRPYFINRQPHSSHRSEIQAAGFEIVCEERIESPPLPRHRLAARNSGASPTPISRPPARLHPSLETITCTKRHLASGGSPPPQNHPRNLPDARAFPLEDVRSGRTGGNRPLRSGDQGRAAFVRKLPDHLLRPLGGSRPRGGRPGRLGVQPQRRNPGLRLGSLGRAGIFRMGRIDPRPVPQRPLHGIGSDSVVPEAHNEAGESYGWRAAKSSARGWTSGI